VSAWYLHPKFGMLSSYDSLVIPAKQYAKENVRTAEMMFYILQKEIHFQKMHISGLIVTMHHLNTLY
jgi:hypothetical protein